MRLQISSGSGLELILPRGYEIKEAESFILKKASWIKKHLSSVKVKENEFFLFGKELKVNQTFDLFIKRHRVSFKNGELSIVSPEGSTEKPKKIYEACLRHSARTYIEQRARELATRFNFKIGRISIRAQKTRWGSASGRGNLSFNYRLLKYRKEVIDYVIIHELCHLKEMNHSKKFWLLVEKYSPNYKQLRYELKKKNS